MLAYTTRRLVVAIPLTFLISLIVFLLIDLAPGSPLSQIPMTMPPEVRVKIVQALGADQPLYTRYVLWLKQFFIAEPLVGLDNLFGSDMSAGMARIISWQSRTPVMDIIIERLPQTLVVVGSSYILGVFIALPIGIYSAYRQYSWFDQAGTLISMVGFSVPTFFSGLILIMLFSVNLHWFPTIYDTNLKVVNWASFWMQVRQMVMPVTVLAFYNAAQISRYMRAAILENMTKDYVKAARAKGMPEHIVILKHVLRNSMISVVNVISLGIPSIFGGAIITEQVFGVNGLGELLISSIEAGDLPMTQTITVLFAILIILFNLIADIICGILDPRIRYEK